MAEPPHAAAAAAAPDEAVPSPRWCGLIDDALRDATTGIGKPEPLRHMLWGTWSRRISEEHRLVYLVDGDDLVILQARDHYR